MPTTVWFDSDTHERLKALRDKLGQPSLAATVRALMDTPQTATQIYAARKAAVDAVCRRHGVKRLIAFGSRARGDGDALSDLDVAVELPPGKGLEIVTVFEDLRQAFACPMDIISYPPDRPRMRANVDRDGVVLYPE